MKRRMSLISQALMAAAGTLGLAGSVLAAPSYGDIAAPGVYFGSGNVNGNWTIDTSNNIEVALRAKDRGTLATIDGSSGAYFVSNPGFCNPVCGGSNKAAWNYEFSVNVRADGTGTADLSDFIVQMEVDTDPTAGMNWVVLNVLSNWPDTAYWDGSAPRINRQSPIAGEFGAQQSANPMFGDSGYGYLPGRGTFDLRLSVYAPSTQGQPTLLAQTGATVQVPEPGSLALAGLALFGLAAARRRKTA